MIVQEKIEETVGRYGGLYAEDRPRYETKVYCDRCGIEKPEGSDGAGWCSGKPLRSIFDTACSENKDICPSCIKTDEERDLAVSNLRNYIHHSIWARGSKIRRMLKAIEQEQRALSSDCLKVRKVLNRYNPKNMESLVRKISQALKSAKVVEEQDPYSIFNPPDTDPYP